LLASRHLTRSTAARACRCLASMVPASCQPCRICRHGGAGPSARLNPAEASLMFPMALRALRPTARQRRESGAKGRALSGSFRTGNRALDSVFPEAIRTGSGLWHSGGAPPARRFPGWGPPPNHPLVRSMSHRIAMPRQHAPAHRGTDPPGVSQTNNGKSPPAPGGVWGRHNFNPEGVVFLSLGQGELHEPPP